MSQTAPGRRLPSISAGRNLHNVPAVLIFRLPEGNFLIVL